MSRSVAQRAVNSVQVRVEAVGHGVATVAVGVAQAVPPAAVVLTAAVVPTVIVAAPTVAGLAGAAPTAVGVGVRARCTSPLAVPVETKRVCHSCHAVTVPCIAVTALAVSVKVGPPGSQKTSSHNRVPMSAGVVRRSRTLFRDRSAPLATRWFPPGIRAWGPGVPSRLVRVKEVMSVCSFLSVMVNHRKAC